MVPSLARAETIALVPPGADAGPSDASGLQIVARALAAQGATVLDTEAVGAATAATPVADCHAASCAGVLASTVGADLALLVSVHGDDEPLAHVVLVDREGHVFPGQAPLGDDARGALLSALAAARERRALGPGPWLRLRGEPAGAVVQIDGVEAGVLPYRAPIRPGAHTLLLRAPGRLDLERSITVPDDAATELEEDVRLPIDSRDRPRQNLFGPIILGVAGLAGLTLAVYGLAAPEGCARIAPSGRCLYVTDQPAVAPIIVYGLAGLAAIGGALLWYFVGGDAQSMAGIQVWVAPDGLGAGARGRF